MIKKIIKSTNSRYEEIYVFILRNYCEILFYIY